MAAERVSMRKTHEVLRLHFDLKLKQRQIARSADLSQSPTWGITTMRPRSGFSTVLDSGASLASAKSVLAGWQ